MKFISFDVGIKNMAYCVFDCSGSPDLPKIVDWNVLNLMETEPEYYCNALKKNGNTCNKKGKYVKGDCIFCEKHAKLSEYLMPCSPNYFKKMKKPELIKEIIKYIPDKQHGTREVMLQNIHQYFLERGLTMIGKTKKKANTIDLITIGKRIKSQCNNVESMRTLDTVIIENQISPIANRMKTIQGMLMQYFIMLYENVKIECLSSSGKLKGFEKMNSNVTSEYKQHKNDAIFYCRQFLEKDGYSEWRELFESHNKKDDLADSFLQGIWYFNNKINK